MRVLFLSRWFPFPPNNGSELRINALLRGLAAQHEVTLASFTGRNVHEDDLGRVGAALEEVYVVPWRPFRPNSTRAWTGFLSKKPRSVIDTYSHEMASLVAQLVASRAFDLAVVSQLTSASYASSLGLVPAVLEELEIGAYVQSGPGHEFSGAQLRHRLMWAKQRAYVRELLPRFQACTVVSSAERALVTDIAPWYDRVELIPNCIDLGQYHDVSVDRQTETLIFTGAFTYWPNYEAMLWFLEEVYPIVRAEVPGVRLIITGDHDDRPLPLDDSVSLTGQVPDIKPLVAAATVAIVPIRHGGGTRLKILEAMALRTPVVATTKGAEGLNVSDGVHLLLGNTPQDFATAVVRIISDARLREAVAAHAFQYVGCHHSWEVVMPRFLDLVERVGATPRGAES